MGNNDILSKILLEASSYNAIEDIERLVEVGMDLSMIPIQPLYIAMLSSSSDQVAELMHRVSPKQRQAFFDLDLWKKDRVDVNSFEFWIEVYSKVQDLDLIQEFVDTEDFLIYLKSRINIYTFDVEEPEYPDHDNYFLTDDMLLLVEYSEDYKFPNELKYMIRNLYDKLGVEGAYTTLFKLINDSYSLLEEKHYQLKKARLEEYGFVDYYDALEKLHTFATYGQIDNYIKNKKPMTATIGVQSQNQSLHSSSLVSFRSEMDNISQELSLVKDNSRLSYLHFTFIRLINSTIALQDALKGGRVELTRIGKETRSYLDLGLQKVKEVKQYSENESVFLCFDFFDLCKVGASLIMIEKNRIKKVLRKTPFEQNDYESFLGAWWGSFLENSDEVIPKVKSFGAGLHAKQVNSMEAYRFWKQEVDLFVDSVPFINSFFKMISSLKEEGKLHDDFYLNYNVENIDFEAILISSFVNFSLGNFSGNDVNKMGVTISELRAFFKLYFFKQRMSTLSFP
ncbi:MAG: hypothetical protein HON90_04195 [Halobacteriovoraceae bacterium]|nr:hypothetical protein [Halobacteriovoraceae bacterium]